ncbi:streptophobe family protein [Streptomyces sp. 4F14]|uniref:streptophobe family protein n=1 Tax=Streptomyces sp. 4F14 TaxID=3394380 RepID=UPI003A85E1D8
MIDSVPSRHGWVQALGAVLAGVCAMGLVAALGLLTAGATDLPDGAFPSVVAASVVTAVGGTVKLSGAAGALADGGAGMTVIPLSVTLAGALVLGAGFLRPLRHRAVAGAAELAGWAARLAALWLLALLGIALAARHTFTIPLGQGTLGDLADLFGADPKVGFTTDVPLTLLVGLVWLAGVLLLALLVSRGAPLPGRLLRVQETVRPVSYAVLVLLLVWVALGVLAALGVVVGRGHRAETVAVVLLGMPNLMWLTLTLGLGASWEGRVQGPFGLPMPEVLDGVMRTPDISTVDLSSLAAQDGRVWWLLAVEAVLLLAAARVMVRRSPAGMPAWRHGLHLAVALTLAVLAVFLLCRTEARYGLSVLGIGDLGGGLGGSLVLRPRWWPGLALAALWGFAAGFIAGCLPRRARRPSPAAAVRP